METAIMQIEQYAVGTPVIAYGIETTITEVVAVNDREPDYTNYAVAHWCGYFWHCELIAVYPLPDHLDRRWQSWLASVSLH